MNVAAALRNCRLFADLPEGSLQRIAGIAAARKHAAGATLFEPGDAADRFYVVASGRVKVFKLGEQGREQILHVVHPGESFAEAAIFSGGAFPAAAETLEESVLLAVPAAPFLALLRADPELPLQLIAGLTRWLRRLVDLVEDLSLRDVQARFCGFLLREAQARSVDLRSGARIPLGTTKALLARRLGTVGETLSRTLYKLQQEGAIRVVGRDILVLDPRRLRAHIEPFAASSRKNAKA
jgi:CRP/FNR family transcriptional regulator, dissimilatory nitrate respiration regulator